MAPWAMLMALVTWSVVVFNSAAARADFGEIDLITQESVAAFFQDYGFQVDMSRFQYNGPESLEKGNTLVIKSSVWAEQRQIRPFWGWYDCVTKIAVIKPGVYRDLGSECAFHPE
jgi:hypothetical protein